MGDREGGALDQGPEATALWSLRSRWHLLLLRPKKELVHPFYSFADIRIRPVNEKKTIFLPSGGLLFCKECVNILYRALYEIHSHVWLLISSPVILSTHHLFGVGPDHRHLAWDCVCGLPGSLALPGELG